MKHCQSLKAGVLLKVSNRSRHVVWEKNNYRNYSDEVQRWHSQTFASLQIILKNDLLVEKKLYLWLKTLAQVKQQSAVDDPEMFGIYTVLTADDKEILQELLNHFINQLVSIIT